MNYEAFLEAVKATGLSKDNLAKSTCHTSAVDVKEWKEVQEALKNKLFNNNIAIGVCLGVSIAI
jgi:hypothetical protein